MDPNTPSAESTINTVSNIVKAAAPIVAMATPQGAAAYAIIMAVLPLVTTGADLIVRWIRAYREEAMRTGEWTAVQEAEFIAKLGNWGPEHLPDSDVT